MGPRLRYAMVCSSNQNRSMEAHALLKRQGFDVSSYGTGAHVKLPGPSLREPNVYDFGTPYKYMHDELRRKDPDLYKRNGILPMLKRNLGVKNAPQRWQDNAADGYFDVVMTFEEKVFDTVTEDLSNRELQLIKSVLVINLEVKDNHEEAAAAAKLALDLCQEVEASLDAQNKTRSRVVVGRHGIHIRPWAHPDLTEVTQAHWIIERVQREQWLQYGVRSPRPIIVVTPTYVRTFQTLHLTGLLHSLLLVPYPLTWLVVEAAPVGRPSNDTASFLARSGLNFLHIPFPEPMPEESRYRRHAEARMRLHALRVVRQRRMDGIVVFTDDSNVHTVELFDEAQKVKWMGAISVGILTHTGRSDAMGDPEVGEEEKEEKSPMPIQGPACNSSGHLVGWYTYNPLPNTGAAFIGAGRTVLPMKMEWAGFVLNSRMLWREVEDKPDWVRLLGLAYWVVCLE
ncbi:putative glucuronosyltransferase [Canna indica]|uniref:Glycosyltransferases n=1 Tax=Canna indica TaxID=4628 RepID=A0AAQ3QHY1_9LILI|nr:putative glucuronosyltransferase [Canna indica]